MLLDSAVGLAVDQYFNLQKELQEKLDCRTILDCREHYWYRVKDGYYTKLVYNKKLITKDSFVDKNNNIIYGINDSIYISNDYQRIENELIILKEKYDKNCIVLSINKEMKDEDLKKLYQKIYNFVDLG